MVLIIRSEPGKPWKKLLIILLDRLLLVTLATIESRHPSSAAPFTLLSPTSFAIEYNLFLNDPLSSFISLF